MGDAMEECCGSVVCGKDFKLQCFPEDGESIVGRGMGYRYSISWL